MIMFHWEGKLLIIGVRHPAMLFWVYLRGEGREVFIGSVGANYETKILVFNRFTHDGSLFGERLGWCTIVIVFSGRVVHIHIYIYTQMYMAGKVEWDHRKGYFSHP